MANGEPAMGVNDPVTGSIFYALIVPLFSLVAYTKRPDGCTTIEFVSDPEAKGDPGTGVSAPVTGSTEYPEIVLGLPLLAT